MKKTEQKSFRIFEIFREIRGWDQTLQTHVFELQSFMEPWQWRKFEVPVGWRIRRSWRCLEAKIFVPQEAAGAAAPSRSRLSLFVVVVFVFVLLVFGFLGSPWHRFLDSSSLPGFQNSPGSSILSLSGSLVMAVWGNWFSIQFWIFWLLGYVGFEIWNCCGLARVKLRKNWGIFVCNLICLGRNLS